MIPSGAAASAVVRYDGVKGPAVAFEQYSDVILTQDIQECDLRTDDIGMVVECHSVVGTGTGYSVEFFDMLGNTVAVVAVPETALRRPTVADRVAVRSVPWSQQR